ncbi:MAG: NAD(P)/FAD-dependent oxidoreductase [Pseudomonadota bacterium]
MAARNTPHHIDVLIIGAGAAGLFCGAEAGRRGRNCLVIDHAAKPAEKVRISGGGRCNFTNIYTDASKFISDNPHFAKSALARYTPDDFLDLLRKHDVTWHEKTLGQLFCDSRSQTIIQMLLDELAAGGGRLQLGVSVSEIAQAGDKYRIETSEGAYLAESLVIATGGLSIPKMGATGFAYDVAQQFGHEIIEPRPALVPFVFSGADKEDFASLSGVACFVRAMAGPAVFDEAMLFTHRGLSGPAILQVSSYWTEGEHVTLNLFAGDAGDDLLKADKAAHPKRTVGASLEARLPKRLVALLGQRGMAPVDKKLADMSHEALERAGAAMSQWRLKPSGTEGWRTAEVTAGGVATHGLSSKTLESRHAPGLYFIGECVDVTGWLGGYNFQWAWASAAAAGAVV